MKEEYTIPINIAFVSALQRCMDDVQQREGNRYLEFIDIRIFYQKWKTSNLGFNNYTFDSKPQRDGIFLAPTFVFKISQTVRYIYHNSKYAYTLVGHPSINYYDCVRNRSLPGQDAFNYLVSG